MTGKEAYDWSMRLEDGYHELVKGELNCLEQARKYFWSDMSPKGINLMKSYRLDFATPVRFDTGTSKIFYTVFVWTENTDIY